MGISGSGKSTVGGLLAQKTGMRFAEGDTYHPARNVAKMSAGEALNDDDRLPWLQSMARDIRAWADNDVVAVISCSALKKSYRKILSGNHANVRFVHLHGEADIVRKRMSKRLDHFMPTSLIESQIATLEMPDDNEKIFHVDIAQAPETIADIIISKFNLSSL
jgi:gluconokinase